MASVTRAGFEAVWTGATAPAYSTLRVVAGMVVVILAFGGSGYRPTRSRHILVERPERT